MAAKELILKKCLLLDRELLADRQHPDIIWVYLMANCSLFDLDSGVWKLDESSITDGAVTAVATEKNISVHRVKVSIDFYVDKFFEKTREGLLMWENRWPHYVHMYVDVNYIYENFSRVECNALLQLGRQWVINNIAGRATAFSPRLFVTNAGYNSFPGARVDEYQAAIDKLTDMGCIEHEPWTGFEERLTKLRI